MPILSPRAAAISTRFLRCSIRTLCSAPILAGIAAGASGEVRGAQAVAEAALKARARFAQPALVNGALGIVVAPRGRLRFVIALTFTGGKIAEMNLIANPERLQQFELAALDG